MSVAVTHSYKYLKIQKFNQENWEEKHFDYFLFKLDEIQCCQNIIKTVHNVHYIKVYILQKSKY